MEIGCHLPVYGGAATREGLLLVARRLESLAYDSLWVSDHVVIPWAIRSRYPYNPTGDFPLSPSTDFLEPLTALTLAAAVTSRVRLGTSVLVSFAGEFFRFDDLGCRPRPAHGTIPIWIGGHTERALTRVAALGDGWHAAFPTAEALKGGIAGLHAACRKAGRDPASVTISARLGLSARRPPAALLTELRTLRDLGVAHVILETRQRDVAEMTDTYERFATQVRAKL